MDDMIAEALKLTTDTKACVIGPGAVARTAAMFGELFPSAREAFLVADPNTMRVAGDEVRKTLEASGVACTVFLFGEDGRPFHAEYPLVTELVEAYRAKAPAGAVPVAVGSGTVNDLVKRASEELGCRYMVVGTAASMDGYTSFGAAITKDGMKQTLSCKAPLGCIVDSAVAAAAPREMTASGYADLIAKISAGADWMLADVIGSEAIHPEAWKFVQDSLRTALDNPAGCAGGDIAEVEKLCVGLVMSGFAMQAMNSSRPASGTEHQIAHYWDMEDLSYNGNPVSHGFKVGIGTLASVKTLEFIVSRDWGNFDVDAAAAKWWPDFAALSSTFPSVFGDRPAHILRAQGEMAKKYSSPEAVRRELSLIKSVWPELSVKLKKQLMPFEEVRAKLKAVGAPCEPEEIGVSRERFRETFAGVTYMRSRYFGLDLVARMGLEDELSASLFGPGGIWDVHVV